MANPPEDEKPPTAAEPRLSLAFGLAVALAVVHLCLALWFASITPYRQAGVLLSSRRMPVSDIGAPDERQHVNYVRRLLSGDGFPVFNPKDPNLGENYQSHQPPLFYVLEAGWAQVLGVSDLENPQSGVKLRSLNALLGASTVIFVFLLAYWGFRSPGVAVCSASVAALLPMNVALSGAVSNDPLLFLLCTIALAFCARAIWRGWTIADALAVGVAAGLALLTKTTALALLPAILAAVLMSGNNRPKVTSWVAALIPLILLPLGWWVRNQHLYGDPFAINAFNQAFTQSPQASTFINAFGLSTYWMSWVCWWTVRSFFGAFGYMDIWLNESGSPLGAAPNALYRVLIAVSVAALFGWLYSLAKEKGREVRAVNVMNAVFGTVILCLFIKFNTQYFQAQARYVLPAIGPIACAYGLGFRVLCRGRWVAALALLVVIFGGLSVYAGTVLPDQFQRRIVGS